jgi:hypothetical protein
LADRTSGQVEQVGTMQAVVDRMGSPMAAVPVDPIREGVWHQAYAAVAAARPDARTLKFDQIMNPKLDYLRRPGQSRHRRLSYVKIVGALQAVMLDLLFGDFGYYKLIRHNLVSAISAASPSSMPLHLNERV